MKTSHKTTLRMLFAFIFGATLTSSYLYYKRDVAEGSYFKTLANTIIEKRKVYDKDSMIVDAVHLTHSLLQPRNTLFNSTNQVTNVSYDGSLTSDLMTASGACGSYADVLCHLLQTLNFRARIGQMKVRGEFGGHIITEVLTENGWVVLDASYDLCFINPRGRLASFSEVSNNWSYYKTKTPPGYNPAYRYEDIRYTNWTKIPVIMPALKGTLSLLFPKAEMQKISIRPHLLRKYRIFSMLSACLSAISLFVLLKGRLSLSRLGLLNKRVPRPFLTLQIQK
jgi:hypothetical protein